MQRIQHTLESERALALDKEEIFLRLQNREAELIEKLQTALEDQESLEGQVDALMAARKSAEQEAGERLKQVEQASQIINRLETEKGDLNDRIAELDAHLAEVERSRSLRTEEE